MHNVSIDMDRFEADFGTPTAQKIIKILASWSTLSLQDLIDKSQMSKSQVHSTLKRLVKHNIVYSSSRGIYKLHDDPFTNLVKQAYRIKLREVINAEIYQINQLVKTNNLEIAENKFIRLIDQYSPVLHESFSLQLSSISHHFIDTMKDYV